MATVAIAAYQWLIVYLLGESVTKVEAESRKGKGAFAARNNSQVYYCRSLAIAYIEVGREGKPQGKSTCMVLGCPVCCYPHDT